MADVRSRFVGLAIAAAAALSLIWIPAAAQFPAASTLPRDKRPKAAPDKAPKGPAPRAKDGKPDLSGVWGDGGYAADIAKDLDVGAVPLNAEGDKLFKARQASRGKGDPQATCLPAGVPRRDSRPFKIVQKPNLIILLEEGDIHTFRQIFIDGSSHPADLDPTWYGDSRGHWEGDELVVDTIGFNGMTWLDSAGHPTSERLYVTERFSRPDQGHLSVRITIEDPAYYSKPWTVTEVSPLIPDAEIREYVCHSDEIKRVYGK